MGQIEDLVRGYKSHINAPWQKNLAGAQKAIFIVYPKGEERRLRARFTEFEIATQAAGHSWTLFDYTTTFAQWMAAIDYRDEYFRSPDDLSLKLEHEFLDYAAAQLRAVLTDPSVDENTVVGVGGVASLFGFAKVSLILKEIENHISGRLAVFFPGEYDNNNYRLLDARDGWNYLAVPITLHSGA